ncbi:MAG TPA: pyridoxamine 5'-phosphate oxidase family protein [Segeticoccus sp.]|uniref:pyridoxamine 5'-phosphate oxidase family protein n=1 Tax=Segeticoccus sp. TaxID=2706531 RepID=UPI002D80ED7F|nr:pyridoxamine 5'-phosphate oxidase family protein [Segeticoccus sp.]HET8601001.1 pyridoxamine 5'-phosphate oxidase family protein [Segeticoccus sp.]
MERRPDLFPVNFVWNHGTVVFRSASGSKLLSAVPQPVAFEVDGWDEASGSVWSVVVRGRARKAHAPYEVLDALTLPLTPWHRGSPGSSSSSPRASPVARSRPPIRAGERQRTVIAWQASAPVALASHRPSVGAGARADLDRLKAALVAAVIGAHVVMG